ncbi:MAG TPA: hypothetical protein VK507_04165 [Iamia sp.]|nr:hypothetical protein [Iamia sp.]
MSTTPTPADREHIDAGYDVEQLNLALITALGLDPADTAAVNLLVIPGMVPSITVTTQPPADALQAWGGPFTAALDRTSYAVLPGQDAAMPPVRDPGPTDVPAGSPVELEATLVRILPMVVDALNGCQITDDQRAELGAAADSCLEVARQRVAVCLFGPTAASVYGAPDA